MKSVPKFRKTREAFHAHLCRDVLLINSDHVASNADGSNPASKEIALVLAKKLGASSGSRLPGQTSGDLFESICAEFVKTAFASLTHLRPGKWTVAQVSGPEMEIAEFEQYSHLREIERLAQDHPQLKTILGGDYFIKPDVVVFRAPEEDSEINRDGLLVDDTCTRLAPLRKKNNRFSTLHASISCKWTIRSDRTQNSRSEALNLIRNRKGHTPHIMVVTAEPLPSRLASICLGTGDIDCVYHFALPELSETLSEMHYPDAQDMLKTLIEGRRLRDISDLPLDLAL
ncbi:MAG TPA: NgoMIV family type II restriction endonuclease [Candidatus Acidoferrum sp.]|nr:NgoMIV family type II restriction endonuclease [Candidatus Acidoferrum sp.]